MERKSIAIKRIGVTLSLVVATGTTSSVNAAVVLSGNKQANREPTATEPLQVAQRTQQTVISGLSEQPRLIGACRYSPEQSLDIYEDAARTRRIRTLTAPTQGVYLTGIVGTGLAQIKEPVLGWIGTAIIEPCTTPTPTPTPAPTPTPTPTPTPAPTPTRRACYRVTANQLTVRTTPSGNSPALGVYGSGSIVYATTNPPREQVTGDGRVWAEVSAPNGNGWISRTGANGSGENAVRVPDTQCEGG